MAMFKPPPPEPIGRPEATAHYTGPARYGRLTSKTPPACDECVFWLHEHKGVGPPLRRARVRRTVAAGVLLLCTAHANAWKATE